MAVYTIAPDFLKNINNNERVYLREILFVFTSSANSFKVATDKKGVVINTYREIQQNAELIKTWLELMSYIPSPFESIDIDLINIDCESTKFFKLCKETKGFNKIIYYSRQNIAETFICNNNIVYFENKAITILDKDDAKSELNDKNNTINNISNSQVAQGGSSISGSENT